jgi:hypothetical protein
VVDGAAAAKPRKLYVPHHGKACKKGYRKGHLKIRGHRVRVCIRKAKRRSATTSAAPKVKLHAHLDPTFVQDPLNPFHVTYDFSASASQESAGTDQLAATAVEAPATLPAGVLALFSDGKLECSINVGGAIAASRCPVTYEALGDHTVTTIYTSGENSATATEVEHISPLATTTRLQVSYSPFASPVLLDGTNWRWVGDLVVDLGADPAGATPELECPQAGAPDCFALNGPANEQHVYMWPGGCDDATSKPHGPVFINFQAPSSDGSVPPDRQVPAGDIEAGTYYLRGAVVADAPTNAGYQPSEATAPLQFAPEIQGEC